MKQFTTKLPEFKIVGITARTKLANEMDPATAQIGPTVQRYHQDELPGRIQCRKNPGVTFCVYTDYESDYTGEYTFFIGEQVESFDEISDGLSTLTIPSQSYAKFTTESGPMPDVVIGAWQNIWKMSPQQLGDERSYIADFEMYDERAADLENTVLDLYVGVGK